MLVKKVIFDELEKTGIVIKLAEFTGNGVPYVMFEYDLYETDSSKVNLKFIQALKKLNEVFPEYKLYAELDSVAGLKVGGHYDIKLGRTLFNSCHITALHRCVGYIFLEFDQKTKYSTSSYNYFFREDNIEVVRELTGENEQ